MAAAQTVPRASKLWHAGPREELHAAKIIWSVAFPMNQRAEDLMMGAPSEVAPKQLRELHIRVVKPD